MQGRKILLIDDEKDFVATVKYFFETKGYAVTVAYDATTGLQKAKESPNMILLDLRLPDIDGFEVLRRLRVDPAAQGIPIIILSCSRDTRSIFEAKGLKATDYIMKTATLEEVLATVERYLKSDNIKPVEI